jgi:hypothetical protein
VTCGVRVGVVSARDKSALPSSALSRAKYARRFHGLRSLNRFSNPGKRRIHSHLDENDAIGSIAVGGVRRLSTAATRRH